MTREEAINKAINIVVYFEAHFAKSKEAREDAANIIEALEQEPKTGYCKDCKYFEHDSVARIDGIPLIVAHEICSRWGDGCKTKEDGYCFLFEEKEGD